MLRNIYLHGVLKKNFEPCYRMDVATAAEGIRALASQIPGFLEALNDGAYQIIRGDLKTGLELDLTDVVDLKLGKADLHIVPFIVGSKRRGGVAKVIIGAALVGAAVFFAPAAGMGTALGGGVLSTVTYGNIALFGVGLMLAGVTSMLAPEVDSNDGKKDQSYSISGPGNVYEQGGGVPLIYGEVMAGSYTVSGGIDIENIGSGS